ncbi:MFS transporter [Kitasatospora aureofaciens]|uniref:MFS transporter n=1 Tax=Kitasatospora aureofaciens TaxID=1894 RepID=UPI0033DDEBEF
MLSATLVGRLPTAMAPVALLLAARGDHAGTGLGAVLAAVYALTGAIGQPLLGRAVDRTRLSVVALTAAALAGAAFNALALVGPARNPALAIGLAAVAGLATPPLEAGLRAMWPRLLDRRDQDAAFALDSASQPLVFVAGPVVATVLCQLVSPAAALNFCAAAGLAGTAVVATRRPARSRQPAGEPVHWLGPLRSHGLLVLLGAATLLGVALGSMNVYALALADKAGSGWYAGLVPTALSLGSLIGGLLWWPANQALQSVAILFAAPFVPFLLAPSGPGAVALAIIPGLYLARWLTMAFQLGDRLAPSGTKTEAAAWLIAVIGLGSAAGTALAGQFAVHGPETTATVPLAGAVGAAITLNLGRRLISSPS